MANKGFRLGFPTKNVIILVVTVTGKGPYPTYRYTKNPYDTLLNQQNLKIPTKCRSVLFGHVSWILLGRFFDVFLWIKIGFTGLKNDIFGSKRWNLETSKCHLCNFDKVDLEEM